nr:SLBB domain-containing protein [Nitrospiraceae bacterium]
IPVRSGDIINVQKAGMFYVDGEVNKPDAYRLRKNTTLVKAVATAGGLKNDADKIIKIYRDGSSGGRDVITADYDAINRGKQRDVKLAENDIIVVSRSGAKAIIYGLLNTFRGFMNFGNFGVGGGYAQ